VSAKWRDYNRLFRHHLLLTVFTLHLFSISCGSLQPFTHICPISFFSCDLAFSVSELSTVLRKFLCAVEIMTYCVVLQLGWNGKLWSAGHVELCTERNWSWKVILRWTFAGNSDCICSAVSWSCACWQGSSDSFVMNTQFVSDICEFSCSGKFIWLLKILLKLF